VGRDGGGLGMPRGGKVNCTCCQVHKNVELVTDRAGIRMYMRTTKHVLVDSEILVMFRIDRGYFRGRGGEGAGVVGARNVHQSVDRRALACCISGQWGASGIPVFDFE
jgi:hypothetical protein